MPNGLLMIINNMNMSGEQHKKLFLLDAYALIFRAYYAFIKNPRVNSRGQNTSAIFGFLLTLREVLQKQQPTHIGVVFDMPGPTFRHEIYPAYKATRDETPEDIRSAVPYIQKILEAYRIPVISSPGFEADDIIGTLARKASTKGFQTYMMTPDKDFAQLVTESVYMFKPSRSGSESLKWGVEDVRREFSVQDPLQVIDILALMGDTADNIPGAPGVGPKTAMKLVAEFGSIEELFKNVSRLKGKLRETIEGYKAQIELSKKLATIDLNVPIDFDEDELVLEEPDYDKLRLLFNELEFRTFATDLPQAGETRDVSERPGEQTLQTADIHQGTLFTENNQVHDAGKLTIDNVTHNYSLIRSNDELRVFAGTLASLPEFSFDSETTGINPLESRIVALAFSWEKGKGYLVHFPDNEYETRARLDLLKPVFEDASIKKIGQNLKYDIQVLGNYGIEVRGILFDTMIAHYLLEPDMRHNMNLLAETYLSYSPVPIESLIGEKGPNQKSMRDVPVEQLLEYAVEDADVTFQLKEFFLPKIISEGLADLSENIEMPLIRVLADMERTGVKLNKDDLNYIASGLRNDIDSLEKEIHHLAGTEFNISSPKQLGDILFLKLRLDDKARVTKTGQFNTSEEVLQRLVQKHPVVGKVLEYRGLKKLLSTYVETLPDLADPMTGRIHTNFNQAITATGRLSSNNPNLQNIPVKDERGREIRKAFIPEEGNLFLSADYSQIELRLMAHLSKDEGMIADFLSGSDIHAATASKIYGVSINEVTREMRASAKTANFGIIYGISSFGLSERLTISRKEAKDLIDGYFSSYPGVRKYMDESIARAREKGYVTTMFGRRRYLMNINSRNQVVRGNAERNAINAPIQGSAADIIKIAMVRIYDRLNSEKLASKMILQVHDELILEVVQGELEKVKEIVISEMTNAARLDVPLKVDWGTGRNWLEAH